MAPRFAYLPLHRDLQMQIFSNAKNAKETAK